MSGVPEGASPGMPPEGDPAGISPSEYDAILCQPVCGIIRSDVVRATGQHIGSEKTSQCPLAEDAEPRRFFYYICWGVLLLSSREIPLDLQGSMLVHCPCLTMHEGGICVSAEDKPSSKVARTDAGVPTGPSVPQIMPPLQLPFSHFNGMLPAMYAPPPVPCSLRGNCSENACVNT